MNLKSLMINVTANAFSPTRKPVKPSTLVSKGFKILGLMKLTFVPRDLQFWKAIYIRYIRPHIEFAISAWSPHLQKDIETLELVQKFATKAPFVTRTL